MPKRLIPLAIFSALFLCLSGCSGTVEVEGKVVKGSGPLTLTEGEAMKVLLTSEDGKASGSGNVEADGGFKIKTSDGGAIPPGKYKVSYLHYPPPPKDPTQGAPPPVTRDTKEVWDVSSSNRNFVLDIGGGPPAKK